MKNNRSIKQVRALKAGRRLASKPNQIHQEANGWNNGSIHPSVVNGRPISSDDAVQKLAEEWRAQPRWQGVRRSYSAEKVLRLRGSMAIAHTVADQMSKKLWNLLHTEEFVPALGALTGNQAVQMVQAGLKAIYLSGCEFAVDAKLAR